jgi:hypothetical protein
MRKMMGNTVGQLALMSFLLFFAAGCKGGDSGLKGDDPAATSYSLPSSETFGVTSDTGTGTGTDSGTSENLSEAINTVHNPEPGSMILLGIGLAGLARLRRRG